MKCVPENNHLSEKLWQNIVVINILRVLQYSYIKHTPVSVCGMVMQISLTSYTLNWL